MATIKLPYQQTSDRQLNQFQQALSSALQPITSNPIAGCTIITGIALTAGTVNQVPVGLAAPVQGWFLVRLRANATVWDTQDANTTNPSGLLFLNTTANVTVDIAIF